MLKFFAFLASCFLFLCGCNPTDKGCESDDDCRSGRICQDAVCVPNAVSNNANNQNNANNSNNAVNNGNGDCRSNRDCLDDQACTGFEFSTECTPIDDCFVDSSYFSDNGDCGYSWTCAEPALRKIRGIDCVAETGECRCWARDDSGDETFTLIDADVSVCSDVETIENVYNLNCAGRLRYSETLTPG